MTLQTSGTISIGDVATEADVDLPAALGDPALRALAGKKNGVIGLGDFYGAAQSRMVLTANTFSSGVGYVQPSTI